MKANPSDCNQPRQDPEIISDRADSGIVHALGKADLAENLIAGGRNPKFDDPRQGAQVLR
jgi:hypothetical protein